MSIVLLRILAGGQFQSSILAHKQSLLLSLIQKKKKQTNKKKNT